MAKPRGKLKLAPLTWCKWQSPGIGRDRRCRKFLQTYRAGEGHDAIVGGGGFGDVADVPVDVRGADERRDIGEVRALSVGEGGSIGVFGLEVAEFGDGAVEGAFVGQIELGQRLDIFVQRAGGEEGLGFVLAANAHVPGGVNDLAEQETLSLAGGAHVEEESFEELVEFVDFVGMDGELRGVDSVLAGVEEKVCHGAFMIREGANFRALFFGVAWR